MSSAAVLSPPVIPARAPVPHRDRATSRLVRDYVLREVQAIQTRMDRLLPFSCTMTMVPAAAVPQRALLLIERQQKAARAKLRKAAAEFLKWLASPSGHQAGATELQNRFVILKLRFNAVLAQFDIFADVLVQRSELGTGLWIAGLDDLAADSLRLVGSSYEVAELVCYLDRGHGAAIRRARTELPGGDENPVAIIRVPRERMVGLGIGASLVHEVGHQAAAILDLVPPLIARLRMEQQRSSTADRPAWICWERWISEIVADFWSLGHLGITATYGLMGVVGLPRFFMFQINLEGPHPFPWIRVMISIALGRRLYPDAQWDRVERMWRAMYPSQGLPEDARLVLAALQRTIGRCADLLLQHRPPLLSGKTLAESMLEQQRSPAALRAVWQQFAGHPLRWHELRPTLAFAAIGQARVEGRINPLQESRLISRLLLDWAVKSSLTGSRSPAEG